jgi:hydrogenase maturation protease
MVVVGIGNTIRSDDGFGVRAMQQLARDPRVPPGVEFLDGGTLGIELLTYVSDSTHLLLLDAVDRGQSPGTPFRMANDELRGLPCAASVHQVGLADLLATLPLVSTAPRETVLLGAQPLSTEWGTQLSAPVEAALDLVVAAAVAQLVCWSQCDVAGAITNAVRAEVCAGG